MLVTLVYMEEKSGNFSLSGRVIIPQVTNGILFLLRLMFAAKQRANVLDACSFSRGQTFKDHFFVGKLAVEFLERG